MEMIRAGNKRWYYTTVPWTLFFQSTSHTLMKKFYTLCYVVSALVLTTGCRSLFPAEDAVPQNSWTTYQQAQSAFDKILPHQTTVTDLRKMGFDPTNSPNIKVLTYLDVIQRFLLSQSITKSDLPPDV